MLAAIVDRRPVLLCAADATPPAVCDGSIGAAEARATDAPGERASATGERERCPDGLAVLSSGTLGTPKTIWHDPRDLLATAALVMRRLALGADDRVLVTVPLHHMYGLGAALIPALLAGAQVHLLPKANLLSFNDALRAAAPSWVYSTPHLLRTLVQRKQTAISPPCSLVLAGDGIPEPLRAQAQLVFQRVFDLYGSSELGVIAISGPNQPRALHPLDGVRAFAAEAGAAQTRLLVRHPHAATHIAQTDAPIALPQAWDTGDIAIFHHEGGFAIQGRADLSLNRAGKLLVLADLERAIMAWPGVDLAVAIALDEDSAAGKAIAVVIQPSSPALTVDALKRHAADTLPVFARPDRYALAAELPRLSSGKPDRNTITKDYRHG
nr:class I adenylate-forming enzyme family protein [Lysobacter enzymogenes]